MSAAIYARYSTDLQSASSIEDQVRLCRARIEAEGWSLVNTYTDHALSGAQPSRPPCIGRCGKRRQHCIDARLVRSGRIVDVDPHREPSWIRQRPLLVSTKDCYTVPPGNKRGRSEWRRSS